MSRNGISRLCSCFNPRAREGRDLLIPMAIAIELNVSIHAPARGATRKRSCVYPFIKVSIHAPARGATSLTG